jgi:gas vesicle protein
MTRKTSGSALLLFGSVVGAGLALLYAPYSGVKNRKKMLHFGKVMSKRSDRALRNFNEMISDFGDTMGSMGKRVSFLHR